MNGQWTCAAFDQRVPAACVWDKNPPRGSGHCLRTDFQLKLHAPTDELTCR